AREKVEELSVQASACKKDAERRAAAQKQQEEAKPGKGDSGAAENLTDDSKSKNKSDATPTPGPSLSEEEQKLVPLCGKQ
ncbi:protein phosphatase, partial [Streptomyces fulvissimus]|nr:protein phosphatase [Streptomyces microflavus]